MYESKQLIIGAGPVGLAMADALNRHGIDYDHVEAAAGLGGNWHHGVYSTVHTVSSKRSTAFSDYPMPDDYPEFPSGAQMLRYLENYARDRGLADRITYDKAVTRAEPLSDWSWRVRFADGEERVYKGVIVCNGHHWDKRMPALEGQFAGTLIHSKDYREPRDLQGRRVLVIGGGNSGCDVACEAARVATSCDWSLREGVWLLPKIALGKPLTDLSVWWLPVWLQRPILRALIKVMIGDYRRYGLPKPRHKLFERHPTYGTDALGYLKQGRIKPRPGIARVDGHTVTFKDGSQGEYDMIVAATGFNNALPMLPAGLVETRGDAIGVVGGAFVDKAKNLLAVGFAQPRTGFGPVITPAADMYARLIKIQDRFEDPIAALLRFSGKVPMASPYIDPVATRRELWFGRLQLKMVDIEIWRYRRHKQRQAAKAARDEAKAAQTRDGVTGTASARTIGDGPRA
ncbi:MAG: NAD(P)-binding domain-containing protein [Hyphomicrobiaceae bacterium]